MAMKVTPAEVTALREAIAPHDTESIREVYRKRDFPRSAAVKDIDKRYRWDLFWHVKGHNILSSEYNDSHIDTALRSIVPPLEG